jgi:hypothetical protein
MGEDFSDLQALSANNCGISSLHSFPSFPALIKLELSDNRISGNLDKIAAACPRLRGLDLSSNKIRDVEKLKPLADLAELSSLDLESNPIATADDYPDCVFELLPQLEYIDDKDKEGEDRPSDDEDDDEVDEYDSDTGPPIGGVFAPADQYADDLSDDEDDSDASGAFPADGLNDVDDGAYDEEDEDDADVYGAPVGDLDPLGDGLEDLEGGSEGGSDGELGTEYADEVNDTGDDGAGHDTKRVRTD